MLFSDLQSIDKEGAYRGWLSVKSAKEVGDIPEKYWPYFHDFCECGSENIIKYNLSTMTCCNPKCNIKQGYALAEMFTRFNVKGLKAATCSKIYDAFKQKNEQLKETGRQPILLTDSYVAVLAVKWEDYPTSVSSTAKGVEFYKACSEILTKNLTFPQLVSALAIPSLGSNAEKLLHGFSSAQALTDTIKQLGSVQVFCIKNGFSSPMFAFNFRNAILDVITAEFLFRSNLKQEGIIRLNVCMTGAITFRGTRTTKEKFIQMCNDLCMDENKVPVFEIRMTSAIESNPFILYSRPSSDRKYVAGVNRGTVTDLYGTHPVLLHVDKFYEFLERVMTQWSQRITSLTDSNNQKIMQDILSHSMEETLQISKNQTNSNSKEENQESQLNEVRAF